MKTLKRHIKAGDILKPWLILGPFYEDLSANVQGLTYFERTGATVGRTAMAEILAEAEETILFTSPYEGQIAQFRDQTARWHLVRKPEQYLSWGTYNISNHLGAAFLSTLITPETAGVKHWRLLTLLSSRVVVAMGGSLIFDTAEHTAKREHRVYEYTFEAEIPEVESTLTIGMFRLARMAQVGSRLEITDCDVNARVAPSPSITPERRTCVEEEVASLHLERDIFYPEHTVGLQMDTAPSGTLNVALQSEDNIPLHQVTPKHTGEISLCQGDSIENGTYHIQCTWLDDDNAPLTETTYDIRKITPAPTLLGDEHLETRRRMVLEHYITRYGHRRPIWNQVARYTLGQYNDVDEEKIRETCEFIAARKDCADFVIQGLLRLMYWERDDPKLSPGINALMKDTVLSFKYWVDEPGDTVMYMGSENHRLLFHVAEWMAGQLFPTEEFTNSRQRGLYHATKGRMYITEWLRQRGRFGFDEWHSNSYYPISIAPLLNVYDFTIHEDYKLQQMAGAVLDYMFFNLAADSLHGVLGTTHGRSYGIYVKYPDFENTSSACWLLYGTGSLTQGSSGMCPVLLASSRYRAPSILTKFALDDTSVVESRQRQGILRGTVPHANFCVYRTPDYLISGLQDHRKGEFESSTHVAQVTLDNKIVIFWSCPLTSGEGSGMRPDYWSGHTTLPRVIQYRNVMALTWKLQNYAWMSHCFFEQARFDEVRFETGADDARWAFARVKQGYVGIWSQNGFDVGRAGQYAGRELICEAEENTWLVECGREADWGTFDAFVNALTSAEMHVEGDQVTYHSPSLGDFVTGWDTVPTVNGDSLPLNRYPMVDSPWAHADFGSGELALQYGGEIYEIWFNQ